MKKAAIVFFLCGAVLSFASDKEKLASINKQIAGVERQLERLRKEKKSLLNQIYEIELKYKRESIESQKIAIQLDNTRQEIEKKRREKKELQERIRESRASVGETLRVLYKLGQSAVVKFFIGVESLDELFRNYRLFASLINYKSEEIKELGENILKLEKVDRELQAQLANLVTLRKSKLQNLQRMALLKQDKLDLVSKINNDRRNHIKLLDELKREAGRLDDMMKTKVKEVKSDFTLDTQKIKGKLRWPLKGNVKSTFGKQRSTEFDTYIIQNGIEIEPAGSDSIEAVYDGEVVFADYFKGYGNLVIIEHAQNFHSLYGHCKEIVKKRGEKVTEGDFIATAGDTGSTDRKSLYLEIRKNLKPEDPLRWLRKR